MVYHWQSPWRVRRDKRGLIEAWFPGLRGGRVPTRMGHGRCVLETKTVEVMAAIRSKGNEATEIRR